MNAERRNLATDEQPVEDAYKSLFEQNMNSYKQTADVWGQSDM